ncbi:hypothetical protein ACHWQZ_G011451 [Mnemiopsis leidyi]
MSGREFCLRCDSILPLEITGTAVICRLCQLAHSYTDLLNKEIHSTVIFNTTDVTEEVEELEEGNTGPMTDRKCPGCGNEGMSYTTRQLRGADEGQTVFYLCPKCKYQDNENS